MSSDEKTRRGGAAATVHVLPGRVRRRRRRGEDARGPGAEGERARSARAGPLTGSSPARAGGPGGGMSVFGPRIGVPDKIPDSISTKQHEILVQPCPVHCLGPKVKTYSLFLRNSDLTAYLYLITLEP